MGYVDVANGRFTNGRLFYTTYNKKSDRVLLLIHGAGGNHQSWPPVLRRLEETAVYALDLPGHGRSDPPAHDNIAAYADAVIGFIDALGLQNVTLLGHSMGGAVAQTAVLHHHPAIVQLILIGTGATLPVSDAILNGLMNDPEATVRLANKFSWARTAPERMVAMGAEVLLKVDPAVLHADFVACNRFDVREQLGQIDVPTLVISGENDKMTGVENGRFLADNIPNAQFAIVEGGGHMMALEQPAVVADLVRNYLSQNGRPCGSSENYF